MNVNSYLLLILVQDGHCEAMHADNSLWVSHPGEPNIWLLLVAQKSFVGPHVRDASLLENLKRMHSVTRLLHGSVQSLLDAVSLRHDACGSRKCDGIVWMIGDYILCG